MTNTVTDVLDTCEILYTVEVLSKDTWESLKGVEMRLPEAQEAAELTCQKFLEFGEVARVRVRPTKAAP